MRCYIKTHTSSLQRCTVLGVFFLHLWFWFFPLVTMEINQNRFWNRSVKFITQVSKTQIENAFVSCNEICLSEDLSAFIYLALNVDELRIVVVEVFGLTTRRHIHHVKNFCSGSSKQLTFWGKINVRHCSLGLRICNNFVWAVDNKSRRLVNVDVWLGGFQ